MKRLILTTLLMSFALISVSANEPSYTMEKLKAHTWKLISVGKRSMILPDMADNTGVFMQFSDRNMRFINPRTVAGRIDNDKEQDRTIWSGKDDTYKYYLSDTPDTEFYENKVGKVKNGGYVIVQGTKGTTKRKTPGVYQIVELADTHVTLSLYSPYSDFPQEKYIPYKGEAPKFK